MLDIQDQVQSLVARERETNQQPEGVSVIVVVPLNVKERLGAAELLDAIREVALMLAVDQYPGIALTGQTLHVGLDEYGDDQHEVVLEVGSKSQIVISRSQNNR